MADELPLVIEDLVVLRDRNKVLHAVSLTVDAGPPFAIVGESGSGKTTLLFAVAGLIEAESGHIQVGGANIASLSPRDRARHVGLVFQDHQLFPHFTALANVALAPRLHGLSDPEATARSLLEKLGLGELTGRYPHQLSGGQKQRVAIARCLALRPRVLLFDEPSAALDPKTTRELADLLASLQGESQVIVVSHDRPFVERACPRGVRMGNGKIEASGSTDEIFGESPP